MPHKITAIEPNSPAAGLGLSAGDEVLAIDGKPVKDVFDYRILTRERALTLTIRANSGTIGIRDIKVIKNKYADMGLVFDTGLMDVSKMCANKCVFCFVDQLPPDMRPTLYHKDDDMRLSFLSGNYVTLTNMPNDDLERLIGHRLSPVNISVHTINPKLRVSMLKNPRAALILEQIRRFFDAGIAMNFQIVLCKGINDGAELERTVRGLAAFMPIAQSLSVVPAGLTRFREERGLPYITPHTSADAEEVIAKVTAWQNEFLAERGTRFVYAADEFYVKAGLDVPAYEEYEDFPQIENGIGMLAEFNRETTDALADTREKGAAYAAPAKSVPNVISIVTGIAAAKFMKNAAASIMRALPSADIRVIPVENAFFGENVTVSGLLTGRDITNRLKSEKFGQSVLIPSSAMRHGEDVFLDGVTLAEMSAALGVAVTRVPVDGGELVGEIRRILAPQ